MEQPASKERWLLWLQSATSKGRHRENDQEANCY